MAETLRKQIEENENEISEMKKSYESRLAEAIAKVGFSFCCVVYLLKIVYSNPNSFRNLLFAKTKEMNSKANEINEKSKICAHLANINVDPQLTGSVK